MRYFVPLWLENHSWIIHLWEIFCTSAVGKSYSIYPLHVRYFVPLQLENHTTYHTPVVGKSYPIYPFTWDILYICSWKIILQTGGPVIWISWIFRYFSCSSIHQFGNIYIYHIVWIHTPTVGKSHLCSWKIIWYIVTFFSLLYLLLNPLHHYLITLLQGHMAKHAVALWLTLFFIFDLFYFLSMTH